MIKKNPPPQLDQTTLELAVTVLCRSDPDLARVTQRHGLPPLWDRTPGFATLLHIILEQQVSIASANAAFSKLKQASGEVTPESFLKFSDEELRQFGFSRQKTTYGRGLAEAVRSGSVNLDALHHLPDEAVRETLVQLKGIGPWTVDIYLMEALLRRDIWPTGDLALAKGLQKLKGLSELPSAHRQREISEVWKPWRAVAARIIWHNYLSEGM